MNLPLEVSKSNQNRTIIITYTQLKVPHGNKVSQDDEDDYHDDNCAITLYDCALFAVV